MPVTDERTGKKRRQGAQLCHGFRYQRWRILVFVPRQFFQSDPTLFVVVKMRINSLAFVCVCQEVDGLFIQSCINANVFVDVALNGPGAMRLVALCRMFQDR